MDDLFLILFLVSVIATPVFVVKPNWFAKITKKKLSRLKTSLVMIGITFLMFFLFGISIEPTDQESKVQGVEIEPTITQSPTSTLHPDREQVKVIRVIDGDTIEIDGEKKLRYIGIDTPETKHPTKGIECFGQEAYIKNKDLVEGKIIEIEKDVNDTDRYGRLLRYVYLNDVFINEFLVRKGYANASSYPPDIKYQDLLNKAENEARESGIGLWGNVCKDIIQSTIKPTVIPIIRPTSTPQPTIKNEIPSTSNNYGCSCSKTCSQMSSCDEAYYQLNICGCNRRDGDSDGVPCESICPGG